jgi:hypothetical protein
MITDAVEAGVRAKLHPGVLCPVHPKAPFDHSELAYWMPRDPISAAYVNQWPNLLDLSGERQAILAIQRPAAIILLFDCDNLDSAAVHLHSLNGLLSKIKYLPHA